MGFKPRKQPEPLKCTVVIHRTDGYMLKCDGLSYDTGLAIAAVLNRATEGLPVRVVWDEGGVDHTVKVE